MSGRDEKPVCIACVDAGEDFDYCRVCGRGDPRYDASMRPAAPPAEPRYLFSRPRPSDPIAHPVRGEPGMWACHCGEVLDAERAISDGTKEGAPGPIVLCGRCGCYVAIPRGGEVDEARLEAVRTLEAKLAELESLVPVSEVEKARADERAKVVSEVVEWLPERFAARFRARFAPGTGDDER